MKKLLSAGLLAILVALVTSRPADAWVNAKFSVGLNWSFQSANNTFLWGLYRNGPTPVDGDYGYYNNAPPPAAPGQNGFPWFGKAATPNAPAVATPSTPPPATPGTAYNGYGNPYYTTGYQPNYTDPYWYAPR